ncbi:hypothetical protein [Ahrensia sp. R2A130]|uniref:hypothetical protein n=1 Tax=Ahrensia sp. R2A130 TaxID=744979 RepID=UPI0001E0C2FA|nr:hypothetical protein [Ahrensia sp. R2A130]EFL90203.1 hypothetical protein R2A130_0272 [Ahrensia sp. R2A130]
MASFPPLDVNRAKYDRFREAVVIPCGSDQLAICHDALEEFVGRRLTKEEALEAAIADQATLRAVANATPAHDNVITVTRTILSARSWDAAPYDDGPEDSGPIYLEAVNGSLTR